MSDVNFSDTIGTNLLSTNSSEFEATAKVVGGALDSTERDALEAFSYTDAGLENSQTLKNYAKLCMRLGLAHDKPGQPIIDENGKVNKDLLPSIKGIQSAIELRIENVRGAFSFLTNLIKSNGDTKQQIANNIRQ